jgi:hypothetical protein
MNMNVTVSAYNRPAYLRATLAALSRCEGIGDCRVTVLLDPCEETREQVTTAAKYGFEAVAFSGRAGCNRAILGALSYGFSEMQSEFHLHFEDDTVPSRDAITWFRWAGEAYKHDASVMTVSGYQRISNGRPAECGSRRWFTPWGWGVWRDRWLGIAAGWAKDDSVSWDVVVNHVLRAGRFELFPTVSRIQNIGAEKGTHVPSPEWHTEHHRVAVTADEVDFDPVTRWTHTRTDECADHA